MGCESLSVLRVLQDRSLVEEGGGVQFSGQEQCERDGARTSLRLQRGDTRRYGTRTSLQASSLETRRGLPE